MLSLEKTIDRAAVSYSSVVARLAEAGFGFGLTGKLGHVWLVHWCWCLGLLYGIKSIIKALFGCKELINCL